MPAFAPLERPDEELLEAVMGRGAGVTPAGDVLEVVVAWEVDDECAEEEVAVM